MPKLESAELERYEIRRPLGSGGLGVVYEAIDRETGATVAVKTLHDVTPENLYRLKREFRLLQGLEHPNVCQHYKLFEHEGEWFIVMEHVRGEHILAAIRDELGDYDEPKLRDAMVQLADALSAMHAAGLVHRDLKPSNVLVEPSGRVVLIDFGFVEASATDNKVTRTQAIVGTPAYMAPEQAVQDDVGPAADWYSFGVILFEALTGQLPHDGDTALAVLLNKQRLDPPRVSSLAPDVAADLDELCSELLRAEPALRPSRASVLRRLGKREGLRDSRPVLPSQPSLAGSFVGRTDELAVLRGALAHCSRGRAVSVVVAGPSGVGKSSLVRHFTNEAIAQGALVLAGRCYERESVPYKAFDSVVDALARHLRRLSDGELAALVPKHPELLVRMFPVLGGVSALNVAPGARTPATEPHEQRKLAFGALRDLLARIAQRRSVVIAIDDWQWADADSVVLARDLMRHRESPPVLLVVTTRPADEHQAVARLDAIATADSRRIDLQALVESQAKQLVDKLCKTFAPGLSLDLEAIARETQGHPLYISELVRYAATRGTAGSSEDKAVRLDEAILARIAQLPVEGRAIIDVLAVAGEPLPLDVVRDAVGFEPAVVQRTAAMLRVAHLVRTANADGALEPYHDRVSEAVVASMTDKERLAWHKRIVYAIEASPLARVRPELLLRHLDAIGEGGRAAEMAVAAAYRAANGGAFELAAGLFGIAVRAGQYDERDTRTLRIEMGQALANAGRGHEAAQVFLDAGTDADPATRMDCHRRAAEQLLMSGDLERGLEILSELLADVGVEMPATQKRALAHLLWGRLKLRLRGLTWKRRRETEIAPETLLRLDVLQAASHSLAMVDTVRAADFNSRWLLLALRIGEPSRCALAIATQSAHQASAGDIARGRELIEHVRKLDEYRHDPRLRGLVLLSEGTIAYWACQLAAAEQHARDAERVFREEATGASSELKTARMVLTFALRYRGAWANLRELREEYVEDAERRGDRYVATSVNRYCSVLWLAADDPAGARAMLAEAKWMLPTLAFHTQHWYELDARADIAMYEGTIERDMPELEPLFAGLERSVLLRLVAIRSIALWLRGRLALHIGDDPAARRASTELGKIDNTRAKIFHAMLQAGIAARARDPRAVARFRHARELADAHELRLHAAAARYQLGKLLGGSEGHEHVVAAERTMVVEGIVKPERFADWYAPSLHK